MNNDWFLLFMGGVLSGAFNFLFNLHYRIFTIIGVIITFNIGAFTCFMRQHTPEAIGLSIISSIPLIGLMHFFVVDFDDSTPYWTIASVSAGIAIFIGIIIGSFLGSVARLFFDPNLLA